MNPDVDAAPVPSTLVDATVHAALGFATSTAATTELASAAVITLTERVLQRIHHQYGDHRRDDRRGRLARDRSSGIGSDREKIVTMPANDQAVP